MENTDKSLDNEVLEIYDEIFSLPEPLAIEVLAAYWEALAATCTAEDPCAECRREIQNQLRENGG